MNEEETGINRFAGLEILVFYGIVIMLWGLVVVTVYASATWFFECIG